LSRSLGNQAGILLAKGNLDGAMALLKEQERICRQLGDPYDLGISLVNQALIVGGHHGGRPEARRLMEEAYALATRNDLRRLAAQIEAARRSIG
jgi:hypothetical protein